MAGCEFDLRVGLQVWWTWILLLHGTARWWPALGWSRTCASCTATCTPTWQVSLTSCTDSIQQRSLKMPCLMLKYELTVCQSKSFDRLGSYGA